MNNLKVNPLIGPLTGEITIPSDKSISHRRIIIGALTHGEVNLSNFSSCADCHFTLNIFKNLGLDVDFIDDKTLIINSKQGLIKPDCPLDCGNSGTSMRLIAGILSGQKFNSELIGDISLSKRPMKRIIEPLSLMGAKIESDENKAPLKIKGSKLTGISYESKIASAQVKSSILLAGLFASGETTVIEPYLSRNHSELMLEYFDSDIKAYNSDNKFYTKIRSSFLMPKDLFIPGDISSSAFFLVASSIVKGSDVIIKNVGLNPTRTGIIDVMKQMNADIEILDYRVVNNEPIGDIRVKYSPDLKGIEIKGEIIPRLIDEIPVIVVLALCADGKTVIKDASDLKNKESDRINSLCFELNKTGADIIPTDDGFIINSNGKKQLKGGAELNCYHDHRLIMSFYVASLVSKNANIINDFNWVNTSFPEFLELFGMLGA